MLLLAQIPPPMPVSKAIEGLRAETSPEAATRFWSRWGGHAPIVEPIAGDAKNVLVTYLWRGGADQHVLVFGGTPGYFPKRLVRLAETDVWYRTERTPATARYGYYLNVEPSLANPLNVRADPQNPRVYAESSLVELPGAPSQPWSDPKPGVPQGRIETVEIPSKLLGTTRKGAVYTPSGVPTKGLPVLVVLDGESYGGDPNEPRERAAVPTPVILDNLIAAHRIPPLVAVFVESGATRNRDLGCSEPFAGFLANEVLPWAHRRYATRAGSAAIVGSSRGGLCAAYVAWRHPKAFDKSISLSRAFWYAPGYEGRKPSYLFDEGSWLTRRFVDSPRRNIYLYLTAGLFEAEPSGQVLKESRRLRDVLRAKGYRIDYSEYVGDHDYACWRGQIAEGLQAVFRTRRAKVTRRA